MILCRKLFICFQQIFVRFVFPILPYVNFSKWRVKLQIYTSLTCYFQTIPPRHPLPQYRWVWLLPPLPLIPPHPRQLQPWWNKLAAVFHGSAALPSAGLTCGVQLVGVSPRQCVVVLGHELLSVQKQEVKIFIYFRYVLLLWSKLC